MARYRYRAFRFDFDQNGVDLSPAQRRFIEEAKRHRRYNGFALPIHSTTGLVAGFSVTGAERRPSNEQINRVIAAGKLLDYVISSEIRAQTAMSHDLTLRETKLIRLAAEGYSQSQIADLTGTSHQWTRKSFMEMREKLCVSNNMALVLKAVRLDIIG